MRFKKILLTLAIAALLVAAVPVLFLASVWWHDHSRPLPAPAVGTDDASHLNTNQAAEVIAVAGDSAEAERQLTALVHRANEQGLRISIAGAQHTMGGHTIYPGGIVVDLHRFNRMSLDEKTRILTVGAGARWFEIVPYLDHRGFAVTVMQSNNDFSVGGSLSVNCHGWQNDSPPISSTVESFRLLTASGEIIRCSRTENKELFSLALGGYGLFGVILEANLRVVPNEYYTAETYRVKPADYARRYHELIQDRTDVGMVYGRISIAPGSFLDDGGITLLKRQQSTHPLVDTLAEEKLGPVARLVFRGSVESAFGKNFRWWLESLVGETAGRTLSRNQILNHPSGLYATRDPQLTDILHEYFIPGIRLGEFIEKVRPIFLKYQPELLNITVRSVAPDQDTFLRYAQEEMFGLVMFFQQGRDAASEAAMKALTIELIDAALACGGRYYLPYRPHATAEQFLKSYPQAPEFFALKRRYDPKGIFENTFYLNYAIPLIEKRG